MHDEQQTFWRETYAEEYIAKKIGCLTTNSEFLRGKKCFDRATLLVTS